MLSLSINYSQCLHVAITLRLVLRVLCRGNVLINVDLRAVVLTLVIVGMIGTYLYTRLIIQRVT
ncbi:hypothetical protein ANAPC1_01290 [Anaplasma phagocytophilum]|uniref:Uncharacterized protein n=1 Tax=Anaplasma phagocytophilum TaxID=948 RepID=A0AA45UU36_ANAPH|nr:hypothetical protein ANAPC1_01290 [Anaplasma phagocytophilum]